MNAILHYRVEQRQALSALKRQAGASLMELMVGLALSAVVVTSMVILMGNSLGTATRIIQMSQLTDELRNTMSMLSRDVRRANYNANALYCFANSKCGEADNASAIQAGDLDLKNGDTCLIFGLDRDWDGDASSDNAGAFRRRLVVNDSGQNVGQLEMWVGGSAPDCSTGMTETAPEAGNPFWLAVTDPGLVNITEFVVDNSEDTTDSYSQELAESGGVTLVQKVRFVQLQIEGQLNLDNTISRRIVDTIKVRNDFYEHIEPL